MQDSGWKYDVMIDLSGYRQGHRPTRHDLEAATALDYAEAYTVLAAERAKNDPYGATPLPELLVDRKPTPVGAIPAVEILDPTTDLAELGIVTTDALDGEVL